ncbi:unnamed protein product [Brassica napus]|uniref:(rape) hypothetical protein n=1 Tax=Brassica napus TaxID=3708 RepID=A0A816X2B5_BRANA|nr:unnamed protein product [Brassica napus]
MTAAILREPPHHFCLNYHRRTTHRFTEPHQSSSTPHLHHRDRLPTQERLNSERVNRDRDLIRHSSKQGQRGGLRSTNDLPTESIHRPPTRAQPTNPSQLHKARDKHKNKKLNPRKELRGHRPATMELTEPPRSGSLSGAAELTEPPQPGNLSGDARAMEASTSRDQNDAETKIYLTNLLAANPEEEESQRADLFPERNPPPDPRACRRNLTDRNNHTGN